MQDLFDTFLLLIRLGIGNTNTIGFSGLPNVVDWSGLKALAEKQGLSAVVLDGIEKLPSESRPPQDFLLEWIGEVLQGYEYNFEQYCKAISELAGFYNRNGYKIMILKGYACGLDWPKPEHRPYGDIDIWQFGKQEDADALLAKENGVKIDKSHHHHTVFQWKDFMVENHYDFVNVHDFRSSRELEVIFKDHGQDDSHFIDISGERVYLPSHNLHALFLIRHAVSHFASTYLTLRQILDWAFLVEKHKEEIDWHWLTGLLKKYGMMDFFIIINAICVEELGFAASIFPQVQFNPFLKDRVLEDILNPKFSIEEPKYLIPRLIYKYKRWKGNSWKHEICYNESLCSAFWSGVKSHLLKPASI